MAERKYEDSRSEPQDFLQKKVQPDFQAGFAAEDLSIFWRSCNSKPRLFSKIDFHVPAQILLSTDAEICYYMRMTQEDVRFLIDTKREIEFDWQGKQYSITYGTDDSGRNYILFGETYMGTRYYSFAELMTDAKIQNHYFREMLSVLQGRA